MHCSQTHPCKCLDHQTSDPTGSNRLARISKQPYQQSSTMSSSRAAQKATMNELKLRRMLDHNVRLREELARPRVLNSIACTK